MNRVLHILGSLDQGGIQAFIMNVYRKIYKEVEFDFLVFNTYGKKDYYENEIKELGGKVYHIHSRRESFRKNRTEMENFLRDNSENYCAIHFHAASVSYILPLKLAYKYKYPVRIMHCHNIKQGGSKMHAILHAINRRFIPQWATNYFACSELAGEWMFPEKVLAQSVVVKNGIESSNFTFSEEERKNVRESLGIADDVFVCGNVARFHNQKNHEFLVDIFYEVLRKNPKSVLLLIGEGNTENEIRNKVKNLGMENNVKFLGSRNDVNRLMEAMDAFVFPSLYEGLGIVLIEAQATGLQCYASDDVIPKEVKITDLVQFISLTDAPEMWADKIIASKNETRRSHQEDVVSAGYDITTSAAYLLHTYCGNNAKGEKANGTK